MGMLWDLIQGHLDQYGVRDAALARRMGTSAQTLNSWKKRGLKRPPEPWLLVAAAREIQVEYERVLDAALVDTGYRSRSAYPPPARMFPSRRDIDALRGAAERTLDAYGGKLDRVAIVAAAIEGGIEMMLAGDSLAVAARKGLALALASRGIELVDPPGRLVVDSGEPITPTREPAEPSGRARHP